jgi:hypothetical protein
MAGFLLGPWVVVGGVLASLAGVMVWLGMMLWEGVREDKVEAAAEGAAELEPVRGYGDCPHCGKGHWYSYHREEPCDFCIAKWIDENVEMGRGEV